MKNKFRDAAEKKKTAAAARWKADYEDDQQAVHVAAAAAATAATAAAASTAATAAITAAVAVTADAVAEAILLRKTSPSVRQMSLCDNPLEYTSMAFESKEKARSRRIY